MKILKYYNHSTRYNLLKLICFCVLIIIGGNYSELYAASKFVQVKINVFDTLTKRAIICPQFAVFNAEDSTEIKVLPMTMNETSIFAIPRGPAHYNLIVMSPTLAAVQGNKELEQKIVQQGDFESERIDINMENLKDNENILELPDVYLSRRKIVQLDSVTVTASKVLFYHKKDTLIFNADAFVFAEGSSLDAIIQQLPGVELKKNGQIYVNGKFVDRLLLNGKDLFNGQNQLMLDNLPAYTVKDIAVYNQQGRMSTLLEHNAGDTRYVMDVRLKRQYRTGMLAKVEAGYGTSDRYLAKLFGMIFSENISATVYGGANNLSDTGKPGQGDGAWSKEMMGNGSLSRQFGGFSYTAQGRENIWEMNGSVDIENRSHDRKISSVREDYLENGSNYNYSWSDNPLKDFSLNTSHRYARYLSKRTDLSISPEFRYGKIRDELNGVSLTTKKEASENFSAADVSSIFEQPNDLTDYIVNRNIKKSIEDSKNVFGKVNTLLYIVTKPKGKKNILRFNFDVNYNHDITERFNKYTLTYSDKSTSVGNQYFNNSPSRNWRYEFEGYFKQYLTHIEYADDVHLSYKYSHNNGTETSNLYLLQNLAGYNDSNFPIGYLPPFSDYSQVKDYGQSYRSFLNEDKHSLNVGLSKSVSLKPWSLYMDYNLSIDYLSRRYDYNTFESYHAEKRNVLPTFNTSSRFSRYVMNPEVDRDILRFTGLGIQLKGHPIRYRMIEAIDFANTTNPLFTIMGNPALKDSYEFETSITIEDNNKPKAYKHFSRINYSWILNSLSRGIFYNISTGYQTVKPYNINGNWKFNAEYNFIKYFGRYNRFEFSTRTRPSLTRQADLFEQYSGEIINIDMTPEKRSVYSASVREDLKLGWKTGQHKVALEGGIEYREYNSKNNSFSNFTAYNSNVTVSAILNFPFNWSLSTDVSLYTRRGYLDERLNTSDIIWNLRASKSLFKGKMLIIVDGFDLLHQISNINYTINAQARTEIVTNSIPNYLLFHIQWNFFKNPEKQP